MFGIPIVVALQDCFEPLFLPFHVFLVRLMVIDNKLVFAAFGVLTWTWNDYHLHI